jgi:predicted dehydrogenase
MERSTEIGFGIIGLGSIARTHAEAIGQARGCTFVAGYHADSEKASRFCDEFGGKAYSDLDRFLADPLLDAVVVATPSGMHLDAAIAAIEAGKHVLVEKPIEITTERCDRIIAAAKERGVKLGGVFQSRYHEAARTLKEAIDAGRFGKMSFIGAQFNWYRSQEYYDSGAWRGTWDIDGGGVFMNQGIHAIDLLQWFGGPVSEVFGMTAVRAHERIEVEDTAVAALRFSDGALGVIEGTTATYPGFLKRIEVCGSEGSAILEEDSLLAWQFRQEREGDEEIRSRFSKENGSDIDATKPSGLDPEGHRKAIEDFVRLIEGNASTAISGEEARKPVAIIRAIYESANSHAPVRLQ